jgi:hypothetical protein
MDWDCCGRNVIENPMFEASQRLKFMSYKIFNAILIDNALDGLKKQVEHRKSSAE